MIPAPKPIMVDPAITVKVVYAVQATIFRKVSLGITREQHSDCQRTDPIRANISPETIVQRRPKTSLRLPAKEKETDEAIDQPPTIHEMFTVSPKSVPIGSSMPDGKRNPHEMGHMKAHPSDCHVSWNQHTPSLPRVRRSGSTHYNSSNRVPRRSLDMFRIIFEGCMMWIVKVEGHSVNMASAWFELSHLSGRGNLRRRNEIECLLHFVLVRGFEGM